MYMNTRKISAEYRLSHWAKIMQMRIESGMNIKAFCEEKGFHQNIYYYWQRKLREAACQDMIAAPQKEVSETNKSLVPSGWKICETTKPTNEEKVLPIEIGGCRVLAGTDVDPQLLAKVCKVLVGL